MVSVIGKRRKGIIIVKVLAKMSYTYAIFPHSKFLITDQPLSAQLITLKKGLYKKMAKIHPAKSMLISLSIFMLALILARGKGKTQLI